MEIKNIQFKRITGFTGTFDEAVGRISQEVELNPGEPLICSYSSGTDQESFFLAIGTTCRGEKTFKVFPAFTNLSDFENFVKSKCGENVSFDLEEAVSEDSDISVEKIDGGKYKLKIKDGVISWKELE